MTGASRLIGDIFTNKIQITKIDAPTTSNGTSYGPGSSGQILKSNGTSVYWANDNNNTYTLAGLMGSTAIGKASLPVYWNGSAFKTITSYEGNADTATKASKANITTTAGAVTYYLDTTGTFANDADFTWDATNNILKAPQFKGHLYNGYAYPWGKSDLPFHNVATFTQSVTSRQINTKISFLVTNFYSTEAKGILDVSIRWDLGATTPGFIRSEWMAASSGIDPNNFIVTWSITNAKLVTVKLYAKLTDWYSFNFTKLSEHNWGEYRNEWVLNNAIHGTAYTIASIPAGETQVVSTLATLKNSISGNAATATTATNLSAAPSLTASGNNITVTAGGKTSSAFTVPYATSAGTANAVAWGNVSGKPSTSITWGAGTTNGPTLTVTAAGSSSSALAIPTASETASGIVTNGNQIFRGRKGFGYMSRYGKRDNGEATQWVADTYLFNSAGTQVGEFWYDIGNATNIIKGQYCFSQFSPNSTANTATTGKHETYSLPNVTSGLTENKSYSILTSKSAVTVAQGGTGKTTAREGFHALTAGLTEGTADIDDDTVLMSGNANHTTNDWYYRKGVHVYNYIKGKASGDWGINATSATALKDRTNSTLTYSNYSASGLTAAGISWMTCWNGYELRSISKAETFNVVRDNGGDRRWVQKSGDTMTGRLNNSLVTGGTWIKGTHEGSFYVNTATTASAGNRFQSWYSGKTPSGAWGIGPLSGAEDMYFVYGTDTNYNSGTNNVSTIKFGHDGKVWGAVYNDYAEMRNVPEAQNEDNPLRPGTCVREVGDGTMIPTTERLQRGCKIISDTFGFNIGETDDCKTPIAVSGRALVYLDQNREIAKDYIGWPVCSGPNGTVSIMTEEEEEKYPSRIVGTISEIPDYEKWGSSNVEVNGRIWIYVR